MPDCIAMLDKQDTELECALDFVLYGRKKCFLKKNIHIQNSKRNQKTFFLCFSFDVVTQYSSRCHCVKKHGRYHKTNFYSKYNHEVEDVIKSSKKSLFFTIQILKQAFFCPLNRLTGSKVNACAANLTKVMTKQRDTKV